jgi:glycosyltransferase involved in cell wall biosynthesis
MCQRDPYRACIPPVPEGTARPLWSVMIPTYNSGAYLRETLASVLEQDPGPNVMQVEVVDDHSTEDDPQSVVAELGSGRVVVYRQPENVGHIENFASCLRRSRGKLIHLLHGDDCVRDGFYRKMQRAFEDHPEIGAGFCRQIFMDENGHWQGLSPLEQSQSGLLQNRLERLALEQRIMTPSIVVRREVYETLGGFDGRLVCSEDWEMWVRIAARYPVWYEVEPLALYRMHFHSNTGRHIRTGEDIAYTCKAIDLFKDYLPGEMAERITRKAKQTYALSAVNTAYAASVRGGTSAVRAQLLAALRCSRSPKVISKALSVLGRLAIRCLHCI